MNVAASLNRAYVNYAIVMLTSLCESNRRHIDIYLLNSELTEDDITLISSALQKYDASVHSIKMDLSEYADKLPTFEMWTLEIYYRLLLPEVLPPDADRVLYLDVDTIVHGDISELYDIDFEGADLCASVDSNGRIPLDSYAPEQKKMFVGRAPEDFKYFNSGVILLNIQEIRKKYSFQTYLDAMMEWNYDMVAPDQDILNYVHCRNVKYVDYMKFDLFAKFAYNDGMTYEELLEQNKIIHYAGNKPWNCKYLHYSFEKLWWKYAALTPVYKTLMEGFLESALTNTHLEEEAIRLCEERKQLADALKEANEVLKKFGM